MNFGIFFNSIILAVKRGVAFKVNKKNITFDSIKYGLGEILHNPKYFEIKIRFYPIENSRYREDSKRVKKMLNDRPENSKEIFIKWVEFAASNPGLHEVGKFSIKQINIIKWQSEVSAISRSDEVVCKSERVFLYIPLPPIPAYYFLITRSWKIQIT